jgi:putative transcriptional regulator
MTIFHRRWLAVLAVLAGQLLVAPCSQAQRGPPFAQPQPRSAPVADGALLVASSSLNDAAFSETVVLVLRNDEAGTVGLIVNRPTALAPPEVFPDLAAAFTSYEGRVFRGGPAQPSRPLYLVQGLAAVVIQGPEIVDKVFLGVVPEEVSSIVRVAKDESALRVYAGHAEWAPGQIDDEVARGFWRVVGGSSALIFSANPGTLWREATATVSGSVIADTRVTGP